MSHSPPNDQDHAIRLATMRMALLQIRRRRGLAYATIKGFEVMRALRKGQAAIFNLTRDMRGEAQGNQLK